MALRPETKVPDTGAKIDRSMVDSAVAHEQSIQEYMDRTELAVVEEDQIGVISLVCALEKIGIDLPATKEFFIGEQSIKSMSSGIKGIGRVQCKEIITAGAFPMSLLFGEQKPGWFDTIKGLLGKGGQPSQAGSK